MWKRGSLLEFSRYSRIFELINTAMPDSSKSYILAIDQGTTGSAALLCDSEGEVVSTGYREIRQIYPQPGYVEHDPKEYIRNSLVVAREAIAKAGVSLSQVKGMGITNQRETTVIWDRHTGEPVYNAIVWQCRRTAPMCEELKRRGLSQKVREKTGLPIDPYFSSTKVRWVLDNVPDGQRRAQREFGQDPDKAQVRAPRVVERYEG